MIKYRLACDKGHEFDAWFKCSAAFEVQRDNGHLACAHCASKKIDRAIMAPAQARNRGTLINAEDEKKRKAVNELIERVERDFDYVGDKFADEARKTHYGESAKRDIYGEATFDEAVDLLSEGVPVLPLPKPARKKD